MNLKDINKEERFYQIDYGTFFYFNGYLFVKLLPMTMTVGKDIPTEAKEEKPNAFCLRDFYFTTIDKDAIVEYCGKTTRDQLANVWGYVNSNNYNK